MTEQLSMSATYNIFFLGGRDFVCRRFGATEEVGGWGRAPGGFGSLPGSQYALLELLT